MEDQRGATVEDSKGIRQWGPSGRVGLSREDCGGLCKIRGIRVVRVESGYV